jgi:hypothetical protein
MRIARDLKIKGTPGYAVLIRLADIGRKRFADKPALASE